MELKELVNFLKVAEYENITRASKELHIAQPYLTRQIKSLEEELGVTLFIREKKRIHITDEGRFLKQQAEQILGLTLKTKEQISEMENGISGTLFIGAIETVGTLYLPQWISKFKKRYPKIHYNLWSSNSKDVIERLEKGLIDVALVRGPLDESKYHMFPISEENWVVLINKEHPLSKKSVISLEDLSKEELLVPTQRVNEVTQWFGSKNLDCDIICSFSPLMNGIVMVDHNIGIAILPGSCKQLLYTDKIIVRDLSEEMLSNVFFIYKREYELPSTAKRFIKFVESDLIE